MTSRPAGHHHRGPVRPRYGRIGALTGSLVVTLTALLGSAGVLPVDDTRPPDAADATADQSVAAIALSAFIDPEGRPVETTKVTSPAAPAPREEVGLPARSGRGKRVVFDISDQRVWLVERGGDVSRTYLVSGSLTGNLDPGTYEVYSTSRHAIGIDDSGTMEFMVRFAHGERAAIGFHDIPVKDGKPLQTRAELGTPQSHGCIRQAEPDARALWYFAIVGTTVVVTA